MTTAQMKMNALKNKIKMNHLDYFGLFEDIANVALYKFDVHSKELIDLVNEKYNLKNPPNESRR